MSSVPWWAIAIACITLGLAPFAPEPHVWEKLRMLASGQLRRGIDIFDLFFHGAPWLLALAKLGWLLFDRRKQA
ncbi:MAG: RND transporter [Deltaproteobacteria bacterium]|nr:RND transporter [Deltaproteobacteria bacterium]